MTATLLCFDGVKFCTFTIFIKKEKQYAYAKPKSPLFRYSESRIVQFLFYLNPNFQASNLLLCLYRLSCIRPGWKPKLLDFLCKSSHTMSVIILRVFPGAQKYAFLPLLGSNYQMSREGTVISPQILKYVCFLELISPKFSTVLLQCPSEAASSGTLVP